MSEFLFRFREPLSAAGSAIGMLLLLLPFHAYTPSFSHSITSSTPIELTLNTYDFSRPSDQHVEQLSSTPVISRNIPHEIEASASPITRGEITAAAANLTAQVSAENAMPSASLPPSQVVIGRAIPHSVSSDNSTDSERNAETIYVDRVRAYLQTIKRYPTGREASLQRPVGASRVWFVVSRSGELIDAGIEISSGSMLLDNASLGTVRKSNYPVFPNAAWPGKLNQRFTVELNFVPSN